MSCLCAIACCAIYRAQDRQRIARVCYVVHANDARATLHGQHSGRDACAKSLQSPLCR